MSKPADEKKIAEALDKFRKGVGDLVDEALRAGVMAPNIILPLEMIKINLAMQYINNAQHQMELAVAAEMAAGAGNPNIIPVGKINLKKNG